MSELINNLQQIYNAKLAIKSAIGTQSDELADYASYINALKPNGYTYINENGDFNVSSYEYAYINVPTGGGSGQTITQKNAAWQTKWVPALSTMAAGLYQQDPSYGEPQISTPSGWCIQTAIDGNAAMSEMIAMDCLWIEIYGGNYLSSSMLHDQYVQIFTQMGLTIDSDGYLVSTDDDKLIPFDADEAVISNWTGVNGRGTIGGKRISSLSGGVENAKWDYYGPVFNGTGFDYVYLGQFDYIVNQDAMIQKMITDGVTFINNIPAVNQSTLFNYLEAFQIDEYTPYQTLNITSNGIFDVTTYASAYVNVEGGGGSGETIYLDSIGFSELENLDGMNNMIYHANWNAYAITTQVFTQEYPTAGYLYLLPDSLGISKDNDVNAYLFEPTALSQREYSYTDVPTIEDVDSNIGTTRDYFKARVTFRYNPNIIKVAGTINGVTKPGPWGADGINTIMEPHTINNIYSIVEKLSNTQELITATLSSDINLTNFGSYVLIPIGDTIYLRSQDKFTASNAYFLMSPNFKPQADEMYVMDMLNHKTYDCVLQRTSYKGGFTANKYETVLVDTYNYVGELQQTEIQGIRYGTDSFSWDSSTNTYSYNISIPANGQIQARTTYFELTTDGSTWNKFNFCEDMASSSAQDYVNFKIGSTTSGGNTTYYLVTSTISNYANIPARLPSNYFRNPNNDSLDITIKIDKDTWKVNYEWTPAEPEPEE